MRRISDIIDIQEFQTIQDSFAKATGIAYITVDYKGVPVTKASGFSEFCSLGRQEPEMLKLCYRCDAHGGLCAAMTGKPYIYKCHSDLVDFAVPLIVDENYYGAVLAGQIRLTDENVDLESAVDKKFNWQDYPKLKAAYQKNIEMPLSRLESIASLLYIVVQQLLKQGYENIINEEKYNKNITALEKSILELNIEKTAIKNKSGDFLNELDTNFLFANLSVISRLAFTEKSSNTEQATYAFSEMLRYSLENDKSQLSTLGDEINFIDKYLQFQKIRLEDRLTYEISVSDQYFDVACPFMIFFPIIKNVIKYSIEPRQSGGKINISCKLKHDDIIITIKYSGYGMPREVIESVISHDAFIDKSGNQHNIQNINKYMNHFFGEKYGVEIQNRPGEGDSVITIRLPFNNNYIE